MKEYGVVFRMDDDDDDRFVVLPSFWKLLLWFLRKAYRCKTITIFKDW